MSTRLDEFVWYHNNGDECDLCVIKSIANTRKLTEQDKTDLCFFYTLTYALPSTLYLLDRRNEIRKDTAAFAEMHRRAIHFQSDRKYMGMSDKFFRSLMHWKSSIDGKHETIHSALTENGSLKLGAAKELEKWYGIGRYAAYLFAEAYEGLFNLKPHAGEMSKCVQFDDGKTFVAGILHIFGYDALADRVDSKEGAQVARGGAGTPDAKNNRRGKRNGRRRKHIQA